MPLSLLQGQAAIHALTGSAASLFDALKKNLTVHDASHLSEVNARAAMGPPQNKPTCGYYFKKGQQAVFVSNADHSVVKDRLGKKDKKSQWQRQVRDIELPIGTQEMADLCTHALIDNAGTLFEGNTDTRLLKVSLFKPGYGGRTLRRGGADSDCVGVAVVVAAGAAASPQIVTHFPIDQAAIDAAVALA